MDCSIAGKTALLHALASSDGVQIHNTESIRLLLEGGEGNLLPSVHTTSPTLALAVFVQHQALPSQLLHVPT